MLARLGRMISRDIEAGQGKKEIEEKEKEVGWLFKWISGNRDKDKDRDCPHGQREERQLADPDEQPGCLTGLIDYYTLPSFEDWAVALDVCQSVSASDSSAKEAIRELRIVFKYGKPQSQLSAGRLWAIMLRNSSDIFISQSTSRKFLGTLEKLVLSSKTDPVVKERVLRVLAAAAYATESKKDTGFRDLWKKIKPEDEPDEGIPFDNADPMFDVPPPGAMDAGRWLYESKGLLPPFDHHAGKQQHAQHNQIQHPNSQHCKTGNLPLQEHGDATKESSKNNWSGIEDTLRPLRDRRSERVREDREEEEGWSNLNLSLGEIPNSPPSTSGHSEDGPITPYTTSTPVCDTPPSFVSLRPSDSPIARPLSTISNTTAVPPYSPGDYHPRSWRNTFASAQTYETLPSYHSRRSTRTLNEMAPIPTTRNIRSLPPIPPLPPFVS
ncbi:hypothetical protein AAF712_011870 [Marasmius tenuissimus]|uniref:VHS domain-containing protein n=1 Tax=Marasmius tenuissimus TaxID=585030 RepID=A0ABR2ZJB4_9AGAR